MTYILIDNYKPDIMSIQEANYDPKLICNIRDYNIEYKLLTPQDIRARTVLIIKKGIN